MPLRTPHPGSLIHVDIKKLGNIPGGGGHRTHGRATGTRNSSAHRDPTRPRTTHGRPNLGYSYLRNAVDDHSDAASMRRDHTVIAGVIILGGAGGANDSPSFDRELDCLLGTGCDCCPYVCQDVFIWTFVK